MKAFAAAVVFLLILAPDSRAAEVKYPPYPGVWGRELPVPGRGNPTVDTDIYAAPNGDMLAYESFLADRVRADTLVVRRISFFSGLNVSVPEKELEEQQRKWPGPIPRSRGVRLEFPDGYGIHAGSFHKNLAGAWRRCLGLPVYYAGKNFRYDARKTLVRVFPAEMDVSTSGVGCDPNSQPTTFRTRVRFVHLSSNQDYILSDGTFLTVLDDDFIVRFDRALHSPFIDQHPDLFLVDFAQVEPILAEATRREKEEPGFNPLQFIHDRVAELVTAMPKPTPR
ncbi:MAG: hypothetical protein AB1744_11395 [Candidatus Zixiibacteriota bacterium]